MGRTRSYQDLIVWQKAMKLARAPYLLAEKLPRKEAFGLVTQIQRAAVSVPSNIAEGHGRLTDLQFRHFLGNARGSLCEVQTQIELAQDLGYLNAEELAEFMEQAREVARLINGFITALRDRKGRLPGAFTSLTARRGANSASSARKGLH